MLLLFSCILFNLNKLYFLLINFSYIFKLRIYFIFMKGIVVILDGVADEPCSTLGDKTPLEFAKTENLDHFSSNGEIDYCFPIAEGVAPQSSSGIISLFGADFRDFPRGILEATGAGVSLKEGDLALRCNFATIDNLQNRKLIDRRVGRTLTVNEVRELARAVNEKVKLPFPFELIPTIGHRAVLVFRGKFSANISNADPNYDSGLSVERALDKVPLSEPYDDNASAKLAASLVNTFIQKSHVVLANHDVNLKREKKGLFSANFILCRDAGNKIASYDKLPGNWIGFGYMPLEIGVARVLGMDVYSFDYPEMKSIDSYDHLKKGVELAVKKAIELLKFNFSRYDYFYIHFKETDIPGHDNKPREKVKMIEFIDKKFFGFLRAFLSEHSARILVTSDHTTSCRSKSHTSHPVPVLFYDSLNLKSGVKRFIEREGLKGKRFEGRDLLKKTLFA